MNSYAKKDVFNRLERLLRGEEGYFVTMDRDEPGTYIYVGKHFNVSFNGGAEPEPRLPDERLLEEVEIEVIEVFEEFYDEID